MWAFFKPTRFKLIATVIVVIVVWLSSRFSNWIALQIIFNFYPEMMDSMKDAMTPVFDNMIEELRKKPITRILFAYNTLRFIITAGVSYLGVCIMAKVTTTKDY